METREAYYPIAVLIDELKNEDIQLRLNSIRQLKTIALTLGAEKTRTHLITFLTDTICDEDEVLYALVEQVSSLVPYVGGPEYAYSLLPLLENLASIEENSVRDKAIECLQNLAAIHSPEAMEQYFYPTIKRLAVNEWQPSRVSSCALLSVVYPFIRPSDRCTFYDIIEKLACDDSAHVRRTLASRLGKIAETIVGGGKQEKPSSEQALPTTASSSSDTTVANEDADVEMEKSSDDPVVVDDQKEPVPMQTDNPSVGDHIPTGSTDSDLDEARETVLHLIVPMFERFIKDKEDTVRVYSVESIVGLCKALSNPADIKEYLFSWLQRLAVDDAWTVRCTVAEKVIDIYVAVDPCMAQDTVAPIYFDLLRDEETEVRAMAVSKIKPFTRCIYGLPPTPPEPSTPPATAVATLEDQPSATSDTLSSSAIDNIDSLYIQPTKQSIDSDVPLHPEVLKLSKEACMLRNRLLQRISFLVADMNLHVRRVLASSVLGLAPLFGRTNTIHCLLPVMLKHLMDECPEVRFNLLCNLEYINQVLGVGHLFSTLLQSVIGLSGDRKWRVRLALLDYLPSLADQLGKEAFTQEFSELCVTCLVDEVYAVREAAVQNIGRLSRKFGSEWTRQTFVPHILELSNEENYLHRMICLECIIQLAGVVGPSMCKERLAPTLLSMCSDKVPNIRFKVAEALGKIGQHLDEKTITVQVKQCLNELRSDRDADVQWFAYQALDRLHLIDSAPANPEMDVGDDEPGDSTPTMTEAGQDGVLSFTESGMESGLEI